MEVLEEKKALFREAERIKEASLRFLLEQDEKNEANLLLTL